MSFVNLYLMHPEFLSDDDFHARRFGQPSDRDKTSSPDIDRLRKHTDVQVMQRGVELSGQVVDEAGRPIAGSEVCWFEGQSQLGPDAPKATTAADGGFRFAHVRPGKVRVLAKAARHAPGLVVAQAAAGARTDRAPLDSRTAARGPSRRSAGKADRRGVRQRLPVARLPDLGSDSPDRSRRSIPFGRSPARWRHAQCQSARVPTDPEQERGGRWQGGELHVDPVASDRGQGARRDYQEGTEPARRGRNWDR